MKKAVSPKHYKDIVPGYQYMNLMVYLLKDFVGVESHLMGQIYKYLMRYGKKDSKTQELGKVLWYTSHLMVGQGAKPEEINEIVKEAIDAYRKGNNL